MYSGVIRDRHIFSLSLQSALAGDIKFFSHPDFFVPPLFCYNETHFNHCFFVNKSGLFFLPRSCYFKFQTIANIYPLFNKKTFHINYPRFIDKTQAALKTFHQNNINITFIHFNDIKFNAKNIEYHTNLSKYAVITFNIKTMRY